MDAEDLALALGDALTALAAIQVLGSAIDDRPALLDDHRSRALVADMIDAVMTGGWTTDQIRTAMGERAADLLTW